MTITFSNIKTKQHEEMYELLNYLLTNYKANRLIPLLNYTKDRIDLMDISISDLLNNYYPNKVPTTVLKLAKDVDEYSNFFNLTSLEKNKLIKYTDKAIKNYEQSKLS